MAQKIVCTVYGITYLVADLRDVFDVGLDVVVVDHEEGVVTQDAHCDEEVHERVEHDPAGQCTAPCATAGSAGRRTRSYGDNSRSSSGSHSTARLVGSLGRLPRMEL